MRFIRLRPEKHDKKSLDLEMTGQAPELLTGMTNLDLLFYLNLPNMLLTLSLQSILPIILI